MFSWWCIMWNVWQEALKQCHLQNSQWPSELHLHIPSFWLAVTLELWAIAHFKEPIKFSTRQIPSAWAGDQYCVTANQIRQSTKITQSYSGSNDNGLFVSSILLYAVFKDMDNRRHDGVQFCLWSLAITIKSI